MRRINEIFYSLQGEGHHTGVPSVFVRFSGCNFKCAFCDTDHQSGDLMTDEAICDAVNRFPAQWIILTGGEPSLSIDKEFVSLLKEKTGKRIAIETNGSMPVPDNIDWVTVSPKFGFEGASDYDLKPFRIDELKVVDCGQDLSVYPDLPNVSSETLLYLQPCYVEDEELCKSNRRHTIRRVLENPRWNLSVQTHRFLDIQ